MSSAAFSARVPIKPSRDDLVDAGALAALGVLGLVEFQSTFGGVAYLVVSLLGLSLGIVLTHIANALKQPTIVLLALFLGAFFLLGGAVALRNAPGASPLPTGSTLKSLATVSVYGWKDLLTTLPRVDGVGNLLALPYLLGLLCGLAGYAFARRTSWAFAPVIAPFVVFLSVILLGSVDPSHIVVLSCLFAVGGLTWGTVRSNRVRPVADSGSGRLSRLATAGLLLLLAAGGATLTSGLVPGHAAHDRVVLRKYVNPPPNVESYASPLAAFRHYVGKQSVRGKIVSFGTRDLMSVQGSLPKGTPVRFATLDTYNGVVWAASTDHDGSFGVKPNSFIRVGKTLDNPVSGKTYSMDVDITGYSDYWLPTAGAVQTLSFTDANTAKQASNFRYNLATGTGVEPDKLGTGVSYRLDVADVSPKVLTSHDQLASDGFSDAGAFLKPTATSLAGTSGTSTDQVLRIASSLKALGRYTHGDPGSTFEYYLPGESVGRLSDFVKGVLPGVLYVGDDEQYASALALMIQQLGVPARVVVGTEALPENRTITGADVAAWVEVRATDGTWRTIPTSLFLDKNNPPDKKQLKQKQNDQGGSIVPPPAQGRPKTTSEDPAQSNSDSASQRKRHAAGSGFHLPGWLRALLRFVGPPVLFLGFLVGVIVGAKTLRRRRRRLNGSPAIRLAHGWKELTDHARDLGTVVPGRMTRREQARHIGGTEVGSLAHLADEHTFGAESITDAHVEQFWQQVIQARGAMSASMTRARRLFARVSLASFFPATSGVAR